jgi:hypothetical protein
MYVRASGSCRHPPEAANGNISIETPARALPFESERAAPVGDRLTASSARYSPIYSPTAFNDTSRPGEKWLNRRADARIRTADLDDISIEPRDTASLSERDLDKAPHGEVT